MYICRHCSLLLCFILFPKIKCIVPGEWNLKWQLSAWLTPSQRAEPKEVIRVNLSLFCPLPTQHRDSSCQNSCICGVCQTEPQMPTAHTFARDTQALWVLKSLGPAHVLLTGKLAPKECHFQGHCFYPSLTRQTNLGWRSSHSVQINSNSNEVWFWLCCVWAC